MSWDNYNLTTESDLDVIQEEDINLPYRYRPRGYQSELITQFFDMLEGSSSVKQFCICWHRRAGKDVSFFQLVVAAACMEPGDYYYLLPQANQARRVIWNGMVADSDGIPCRFKDFIPPEMFHSENTQDGRYTLTNGSNIYIGGSDNYNNYVGGNAKGIVYSEWSLCNPLAQAYFKPMINQNDGWELYCFTPRGKNHAFNTLVAAQKEEAKHRWFVSMKTVDDTQKEDGSPVVPQYMIDADLADGMDPDTIRQEYYLDFNAAVKGIIYGRELEATRSEGRVRKVEIQPDVPVLTFWDIGISKGNATAIWLMQPDSDTGNFNLIGYCEAEDEAMPFFVDWLRAFEKKHGVTLGKVFFPHDGANREFSSGLKRHEILMSQGFDVSIVPRTTNIELGIQQTKQIFNRLVFDEERCGVGLNHLERYRRRYNDITATFGSPVHDDSSNCADALRQLGQYFTRPEQEVKNKDNMVKLNRVNLIRKNNYSIGSTSHMMPTNRNAGNAYDITKPMR